MKQKYIIFWNNLAFSMIQRMLVIWSLVPLFLQNSACIFVSSWFTYYWSLHWKIFCITLLACEMSTIVWKFEHFLHCLLWDWNENWPFPDLWSLLTFPDLLIYWVQHFNSVNFKIWNSLAGISSHSLALLVAMLPKANLTSHCKMFSSSWVTKPSCLFRSLRPYLYSSSVYSCHLFLISSASVRSLQFLSFIMPILA